MGSHESEILVIDTASQKRLNTFEPFGLLGIRPFGIWRFGHSAFWNSAFRGTPKLFNFNIKFVIET